MIVEWINYHIWYRRARRVRPTFQYSVPSIQYQVENSILRLWIYGLSLLAPGYWVLGTAFSYLSFGILMNDPHLLHFKVTSTLSRITVNSLPPQGWGFFKRTIFAFEEEFRVPGSEFRVIKTSNSNCNSNRDQTCACFYFYYYFCIWSPSIARVLNLHRVGECCYLWPERVGHVIYLYP